MPINSRLGKKMDLTISRLGINGEGVGEWYGYTVFVEGALPGETVKAKLYEKHRSYGRAAVIERTSDSPHRVKPVCPLFGKCGGCQIMHLSYDEQLITKRQRVVDALERIGKLKGVDVAPCVASPTPLAYRNKIQIPVFPGTPLRFGLYARQTHDLVEMEKCFIHCPLGESAYQHIQEILKRSSLTAYDYRTGAGELRHLLIKTAVHTQEVLVILVTNGPASLALKEAAEKIKESMQEIKGVLQNINTEKDNTVLGQSYVTLVGASHIEETLLGTRFKVSPASFFQVNPAQAEQLYEKVLTDADLQGHETVLDAYCGVGTLSLFLARQAKKVIGVECVPEAIEDAKQNASLNGITNTEFVCDEAEKFISTLEAIDVAILNPPRKGCERTFLETLATLKPQKIVYVSCDPATLARDLAFLVEKGWRIKGAYPFDMFPQTAHVECCVTLTRER